MSSAFDVQASSALETASYRDQSPAVAARFQRIPAIHPAGSSASGPLRISKYR